MNESTNQLINQSSKSMEQYFWRSEWLLRSILRCLLICRSKRSLQVQGFLFHFVAWYLPSCRTTNALLVTTICIWRPSPPSAAWGHAMPLWQGKIQYMLHRKISASPVQRIDI